MSHDGSGVSGMASGVIRYHGPRLTVRRYHGRFFWYSSHVRESISFKILHVRYVKVNVSFRSWSLDLSSRFGIERGSGVR